MLRVYTYIRRAQTEAPLHDPFDAWFKAHPYATRSANYTDLGVSGHLMPTNRPGFSALIDALKADRPDFVLIERLEDLGRDLGATLLARNLLNLHDVDLLCVERGNPPIAA